MGRETAIESDINRVRGKFYIRPILAVVTTNPTQGI
jgi:hypothetical protein